MKYTWQLLLVFAFITVAVLLFFYIRIQPIKIPERSQTFITSEPGSITKPTVTFVNPVKGAKRADVTIIMFGDFTCGPCRLMLEPIEQMLEKYPGKIREVWKSFPNDGGDERATPAAIAAMCANEQNKFWEYHDMLYARQMILSETQYYQIASDLDLDLDMFEKCYTNRNPLAIVRKDVDEGIGLDITASPTFFINDEKFVGAISASELEQEIQKYIK
ncbi:MAG: thioredoxin domain-containing protein [Patescibacteria group bacterium]